MSAAATKTTSAPPKQQPSRHTPHFDKSAIDLQGIVQENKALVQGFLTEEVPGGKSLILDPKAATGLLQLCSATELRSWGFNSWLALGKPVDHIIPANEAKKGALSQSPAHTVFVIVSFEPASAIKLAECLPKLLQGDRTRVLIGVVPRPTEEFLHLLLHYCGVKAKSSISARRLLLRAIPTYLFPVDVDVISLQLPDLCAKYHAGGDPSQLNIAAESLLHLQRYLGGLIERLWSIGTAGKYVCNQLLRFRREIQLQLARTPEKPVGLPLTLPNHPPPIAPFHLEAGSASTSDDDDEEEESDEAADGSTARPKSASEAFGTSSTAGPNTASPFDCFCDGVAECILMDRRVDLVTPFCTPLSYEATVDFFFGLSELEQGGVLPKKEETKGEVKVPFTSADPVFDAIRYMLPTEAAAAVHGKAVEIQNIYAARPQGNLEEFQQYCAVVLDRSFEHQLLPRHVTLSTEIHRLGHSAAFQAALNLEDKILNSDSPDAIQRGLEVMAENELSPEKVYRLLCLYHLTSAGGLKSAFLEPMRKLIVENYGLRELVRMESLAQMSLLPTVSSVASSADKSSTKKDFLWASVQAAFRLCTQLPSAKGWPTAQTIVQSVQADMRDPSVVFGGYAPLTCRLIQLLYSPGGWKDAVQALDLLWGPALEIRQTLLSQQQPQQQKQRPSNGKHSSQTRPAARPPKPSSSPSTLTDEELAAATENRPVTLLVFLGGCTYGEIASLRLLEKIVGRRFVIVTTSMINYRSFLQSF